MGKWLCDDSTGESFQRATFLQTSAWINVQKVRYAQLYQVLPDYSIQPIATKERIDNGCSLEVTHLIIQDHAWWSLAFEAFGEDTQLMENLRAVASWILNTYRGSKLQAEDSYAYPHWLGLVFQ